MSNRNLIINGKHAVNQRGQLPASMIAGYNCTDRWKTYTTVSVSNSLSTVTLPNGDTVSALKGVSDATTTGMIDFYQVIENTNYSAFAGQTMTASCWIRSNSTNARLFIWGNSANIGSVAHSGNGQWEKLTVTFTLPSSPTQLEFYAAIGDNINLSAVSLAAGEYIEFTEAQLEVGDTATPFEHRSYGQELALCQRYYERFAEGRCDYGQIYGAAGNVVQSGRFGIEKRATPTITSAGTPTTSGSTFSNGYTLGSIVGTSLSSSKSYSIIWGASSSGWIPGLVTTLSFSSSSYLEFDAEL